MTTPADTDTQTWVIAGLGHCDACGCSQDAVIIADVANYDRFCLNHTNEAAAVALSYRVFTGWYRITASRFDHTRYRLILTVCPL